MGQGIDRLLADTPQLAALRGQRVGLLSNTACLTADGRTTAAALAAAIGVATDARPTGLARLFAPEHGFAAAAGAGAAVGDGRDPATGLPVHSLYGPRRRPAASALADLDTVVIDLRDVGVRCFTYAATAARHVEALASAAPGLLAVICDRPNPLGSRQAGPRLDPAQRSFLAYLDVPFVHGRSLGGLLAAHNDGLAQPAPLTVIAPGAGDTPWQPPSPGLRAPASVQLYPGLVLVEGTNLSEGRGTDTPFRIAAAPWLDGPALAAALNGVADATGTHAEPATVTPAHGKCAGEACHGVHFTPIDGAPVDGLALGVHLLAILRRHESFRWIAAGPGAAPAVPDEPAFIDRLMGSDSLRRALDAGANADTILADWAAALP